MTAPRSVTRLVAREHHASSRDFESRQEHRAHCARQSSRGPRLKTYTVCSPAPEFPEGLPDREQWPRQERKSASARSHRSRQLERKPKCCRRMRRNSRGEQIRLRNAGPGNVASLAESCRGRANRHHILAKSGVLAVTALFLCDLPFCVGLRYDVALVCRSKHEAAGMMITQNRRCRRSTMSAGWTIGITIISEHHVLSVCNLRPIHPRRQIRKQPPTL